MAGGRGERAIRIDVAAVYPLQVVAQAWREIAGNVPWVHGISPSGPRAARRRSHGKIVLRVTPSRRTIQVKEPPMEPVTFVNVIRGLQKEG